MSSSDSEDSFSYEVFCETRKTQSSSSTRPARLITAILHNDLNTLKNLLDSPKWYNVRDKEGYTLLQLSILWDKPGIFNYLLSIPSFPLEFVNKMGQTALIVALESFKYHHKWTHEYFGYELLKKGACSNVLGSGGNTPLHYAVQRSYCRVMWLLLEQGVDVNVKNGQGCAPLDLALSVKHSKEEIVMALLAYGAKPSVNMFEKSVILEVSDEIQAALLPTTFNDDTTFTIRFLVILKLAEAESPVFYKLMQYPLEVSIQLIEDLHLYFRILCSISLDCLTLIFEKFGSSIRKAFKEIKRVSSFYLSGDDKPIRLENLDYILQNDFEHDISLFISTFNSTEIFENLIKLKCDETHITELYILLSSYGLKTEELTVQLVYQNFGYCELFKFLLFMDIKMGAPKSRLRILPQLIYNINLSGSKILERLDLYTERGFEELLDYFANPKLVECHLKLVKAGGSTKRDSLPKVPLLTELARNAFRTYFIQKLQIKTSKQFYTLLNCLPISPVHRKIIGFETKLY